MKSIIITEETAKKFKVTYSKKMNGTQKVEFFNGQIFEFNDKEFYTGRGSKYNNSSMHEHINVFVTKKMYNDYLKEQRETKKRISLIFKERKERDLRVKQAEKDGIYSLTTNENGTTFVELSNNEQDKCYYNPERLAKTLNISVDDAKLLFSRGKTYVFAKVIDSEEVILLYHPSLFCNRLSISIDKNQNEKFKEFTKENWFNAPFAEEVGNTFKENHFVC